MQGLLLVDKPEGISSFRVVSEIRRLFQVKKAGHCGTLDPFATGLLPLALGRSTALIRYMEDYRKVYLVSCRLGRATDSLDITGRTVASDGEERRGELHKLFTEKARLHEIVSSMKGEIMQVPPLFSAVKVGGKKLYEYAHKGMEAPEVKARLIHVLDADLQDLIWDEKADPAAPLELRIRFQVSKGTYVRSLCEDLGRRLGFHAYASALRRTEVGPFDLKQAWTLDSLRLHSAESDGRQACLIEQEAALIHIPVIKFSEVDLDHFLCGRQVEATMYLKQTQSHDSALRFQIRSTETTLGVCRLAYEQDAPPRFIVERMFTDRESYNH